MKTRNRLYRMKEMCGPFIRPLIIISVLVMCSQAMGLIFFFYTGEFVKSVDMKDMPAFYLFISLLLLIVMGGKIFETLIAHYHIRDIITDLEAHISDLTLKRVCKFSIGQIVNQNSGFKQETLKKGESAISELTFTLFLELIPTIVRIFSTVIVFFFLKAILGIIVLTSIILFVLVSLYVNKKLVPQIRSNRKKETKLSTAYWEVIKHLRLVIASAQEKRALTEYAGRYKEYGDEHKRIWITYIWKIVSIREPFAVLGQIAVIGYAGYLVMLGEIEKSSLITTLGWSTIIFNALGNIGNMQRRLMRNYVLMSRYFDLLEIPPAIKMIDNPVKLQSFHSAIEFRGVSFSHPEFISEGNDDEEDSSGNKKDGMMALKDINVQIMAGEIVALVGPSGSGKSTFINLLQRGYDPDSGEIDIDGHDLKTLDINCWRDLLGLVDQDPKLWDESLRYNILYGLNGSGDNVTEAELDELAKITRIDEFYKRLGPKKFDTVIGENGVQLSGGQRQRVAIARAIIKKPSILILDEATNALDPTNERLVHEAIREAMKGRTGIIIAHRLSTIRRADKIIVFEKGQIVGVGTHEELLDRCKAYQELVECENSALEVG